MLGSLIGGYATILPLIALLIFVGLSLMVIVYVLTDRRHRHHQRMAALALDDSRRDEGADRV
jgi:hypothetical protein